VTDYRLTAHREKFLLRVDFEGPAGPLGSLESTLAVRGPEFLVKDASGAARFTATHRTGFSLRVEFRGAGRDVLGMGAGTTSRRWHTTTEVRPVSIEPSVEPLLALSLATVVLTYV